MVLSDPAVDCTQFFFDSLELRGILNLALFPRFLIINTFSYKFFVVCVRFFLLTYKRSQAARKGQENGYWQVAMRLNEP